MLVGLHSSLFASAAERAALGGSDFGIVIVGLKGGVFVVEEEQRNASIWASGWEE